ncbi:MAG: DMT family transporter [Candidatus Acidiferrales bacterium]
MSRRPSQLLVVAAALLVILIWSLNYVFVKIALGYLSALTVTSFRIVLAALLILPLAFRFRGMKFERRDLWTFAYLGFWGVAVNQGCFTIGLAYTSAGHAAILSALGPVLVMAGAVALRQERLTLVKATGVTLSFGGVATLASEGGLHLHSATLAGDLIILCGAAGYALYTVLGKRVARRYDSLTMNTFNYIVAGLLYSPLALRSAMKLHWAAVDWRGWASLGYAAAIASIAGYIIYYWALRYITATRISALNYLLPVIVTTLGILFLGEHLTARFLLAGSVVLLGVYLTQRSRSEAGEEETPSSASRHSAR